MNTNRGHVGFLENLHVSRLMVKVLNSMGINIDWLSEEQVRELKWVFIFLKRNGCSNDEAMSKVFEEIEKCGDFDTYLFYIVRQDTRVMPYS